MDSRLSSVKLIGADYPLCFSIRASRLLGEIGEAKKDATIQEDYERTIQMLAILLNAGADYAEINGVPVDRRFTEKELEAIIAPADMADITKAVNDALRRGLNREVDVKPSKNAKSAAGGTKAG